MSLEAAIEKNTAMLEKHAALLEQLLSKTGATAAPAATAPAAQAEAAAPAAEDKPKTAKPKAEKPAAETKSETKAEVTVESLTAKFKPWLGEFASDHPETAARKAKFKEVLTKLGAGKLSEITDAAKLGKLQTWFETKALTWDEGHGTGRFAPDESSEPEDGDDDL